MKGTTAEVNSAADTTETEELTHDIVTTVADAKGADLTELSPLYNTIDPEALVQLTEKDVTVEFTYCGYRVVVHEDRRVEITDKGE